MGIEYCYECGEAVDLDTNLEDWDFEMEMCRRCLESKQFIERVEE